MLSRTSYGIVVTAAFLLLMQIILCAGQENKVYPHDKGEMNIVVATETIANMEEKVVLSGYNLLAEIIADKWSGSYSVEIVENAAQAMQRMKSGDANICHISTIDFILHRDEGLLLPEMVTYFGNGNVEEYVLLKKATTEWGAKGDQINADLQVKYYVRGDERLMKLWLRDALGAEPDEVFATFEPVTRASPAILSVFFGQIDGCVVPLATYETACELNPQLSTQLDAYLASPQLPASIFCSRIPYEGVNVDMLTEVALKLKTYPKGRQIFSLTKIESLARFDERYLLPSISLLKKYGWLQAGGAGP